LAGRNAPPTRPVRVLLRESDAAFAGAQARVAACASAQSPTTSSECALPAAQSHRALLLAAAPPAAAYGGVGLGASIRPRSPLPLFWRRSIAGAVCLERVEPPSTRLATAAAVVDAEGDSVRQRQGRKATVSPLRGGGEEGREAEARVFGVACSPQVRTTGRPNSGAPRPLVANALAYLALSRPAFLCSSPSPSFPMGPATLSPASQEKPRK
jgi:hypothetical protein